MFDIYHERLISSYRNFSMKKYIPLPKNFQGQTGLMVNFQTILNDNPSHWDSGINGTVRSNRTFKELISEIILI